MGIKEKLIIFVLLMRELIFGTIMRETLKEENIY